MSPDAPTGDADLGYNLTHAADHNLRVTLEAVRRKGSVSRGELARITGLSVPGIGNILQQLVDDGLVEPTQREDRNLRYRLDPNGPFGIGIDVGPHDAYGLATDLAGRVLACRRLAGTPANTVEALAAALLAEMDGRSAVCAGVGLTAAASVDAASLPARCASHPVQFASGTAAGAIAELLSCTQEERSFVFLTLDESVRAGIVIDGRLFQGVHGRAGRMGSMRIDEANRTLDDVAAWPLIEPDGGPADAARLEAFLELALPWLMDALVALTGFLAPGRILVGGRLPADLRAAIAEGLMRERARRMRDPNQPQWLPGFLSAAGGREAIALGAATLPFLGRFLPDPRSTGASAVPGHGAAHGGAATQAGIAPVEAQEVGERHGRGAPRRSILRARRPVQ